MIRKSFFWLHLVIGVAAGLFIFIMAATGVMLAFERQIISRHRPGRSIGVRCQRCTPAAVERPA